MMQALLQYLVSLHRSTAAYMSPKVQQPLETEKEDKDAKGDRTVCATVLSFLAGPPTMGLGTLMPYLTSKAYFKDKPTSPESKQVTLLAIRHLSHLLRKLKRQLQGRPSFMIRQHWWQLRLASFWICFSFRLGRSVWRCSPLWLSTLEAASGSMTLLQTPC